MYCEEAIVGFLVVVLMSSSIGYGLIFGGAAIFSLYTLVSLRARLAASAASAASLHGVSDMELVSILGDIETRVRRVVGEVDAALELARLEGATDVGALETAARGMVQEELASAQSAACRSYVCAERDAEAALLAADGEGGPVAAAASRIRRIAGRWCVTKRAVLDIMAGTFRLQASLLKGLVEDAAGSGRITSPGALQAFLGSPGVGHRIQGAVGDFTLHKTGLTVLELDEITRKPSWSEVSVDLVRVKSTSSAKQEAWHEARGVACASREAWYSSTSRH